MSIIYDALKKVEGLNTGLNAGLDKGQKSKFKVYLIYALVACFGFFIANIFFGLFKLKTIQTQAPDTLVKNEPQTDTVQVPVEALPSKASTSPSEAIKEDIQEGLVLNGVFFSEDQGYALINNRIVKEGDIIGGLTVQRIDLDSVELESAGSVIKLSYTK